LTTFLASAQYYNINDTTGKDKWQCYGFHVTYTGVQDLKLTNQLLSGFGGGLHNGEISYHRKKYLEFRLSGGYDYLTSPNEYQTNGAWAIAQYRYLFWLPNAAEKHIYLGPYVEAFGQFRITDDLSNNSFNWDVMGGIGPSVHAETNLSALFNLKKWRLYSDLSVPFLAYIFRPNYALPSRDSDYQFTHIGQTLRIQWQTGIQFPASSYNQNQYRIWYRWGMLYHKDNEVQHLTTGRHSIGFSFLFNTKSSRTYEQ
jgi:hypothetical protein